MVGNKRARRSSWRRAYGPLLDELRAPGDRGGNGDHGLVAYRGAERRRAVRRSAADGYDGGARVSCGIATRRCGYGSETR